MLRNAGMYTHTRHHFPSPSTKYSATNSPIGLWSVFHQLSYHKDTDFSHRVIHAAHRVTAREAFVPSPLSVNKHQLGRAGSQSLHGRSAAGLSYLTTPGELTKFQAAQSGQCCTASCRLSPPSRACDYKSQPVIFFGSRTNYNARRAEAEVKKATVN